MKGQTEWAKAALALAEGKQLTPAQLQKSVFLLQELTPDLIDATKYDFEPYKYGPFCKQLYDDVSCLEFAGLASISRGSAQYCLYAARPELVNSYTPDSTNAAVIAYASKLVNWCLSQSFLGLVKAVYKKFPAYKVNSILSNP